jgi:hypothetical protein
MEIFTAIYLLTGKGEMFIDEDKLKSFSAVAENECGDATHIIKNMLYHIKHSEMVKSEIIECYLNYFYSNKSKIASELKESRIPLKHPKSEKK